MLVEAIFALTLQHPTPTPSQWEESVGGMGDPATASRAEQHKRAAMLYAKRGWQPWYHCGKVAKHTTE